MFTKHTVFLSAIILTTAACGSAAGISDQSANASSQMVANDSNSTGPVDVHVTHACVTRSAMISSAQDGNYYTYLVEITVANANANFGSFELLASPYLATDDSGQADLPMGEPVHVDQTSINANGTVSMSLSVDSQSSFINLWQLGVRTLGMRFTPAYSNVLVRVPGDMEHNTGSEITACANF